MIISRIFTYNYKQSLFKHVKIRLACYTELLLLSKYLIIPMNQIYSSLQRRLVPGRQNVTIARWPNSRDLAS